MYAIRSYYVISSSAMQWSKDLKKLIKQLSNTTENINAVLFTSNTFKTIQNITDTKSVITSYSIHYTKLYERGK